MQMEEIQIRYSEVEERLADLRSSIQALETSFPIAIGGQNQLEVVDSLNELNLKLQEAMILYKDLLTKNEQATGKSISTMNETDQQLSAFMKTVY